MTGTYDSDMDSPPATLLLCLLSVGCLPHTIITSTFRSATAVFYF